MECSRPHMKGNQSLLLVGENWGKILKTKCPQEPREHLKHFIKVQRKVRHASKCQAKALPVFIHMEAKQKSLPQLHRSKTRSGLPAPDRYAPALLTHQALRWVLAHLRVAVGSAQGADKHSPESAHGKETAPQRKHPAGTW